MKRNRIGTTDLSVTELCFGAAPIGNLYTAVDDATAHAAVTAAWDGGVRYFDTAPHYGLGLAERRLGAALRDKPRDEYVISTKVGRLLVDNPAPTGSDRATGGFAVPDSLRRVRDYSREGVRRSLDASLTRLGLDRVEIAYIHDPEQHMEQALRETLPALAELRDEGVIRAVGAAMNLASPLLRFAVEGDVDVLMLAGRWTLLDRSGAALLEACMDRGIAVAAAAAFNSGLLAHPTPAPDSFFDYQPAPADVLAFTQRLAATCAAAGAELPAAAVQFPLRHPAIRSVVVGMRTAAEVRANLSALCHPVPASVWTAIAALEADRPARLRG